MAPQKWHFRQAIDYMMTANYAILDLASRMSDTFLYNRYLMGRNKIAGEAATTGPSLLTGSMR